MKTRRPLRLQVEALENRTNPTSVTLDAAGNLNATFGTPTGNVVLTQTADDVIQVQEGTTNLGTYAVSGDLRVTVGNANAAIRVVFELNSFEFSGNVSMTVGNNSDPLVLGYEVFVSGTGTIDGNVYLAKGNGFGQLGVGAGFPTPGLVTIHGNVTMLASTTGDNTISDDLFLGFNFAPFNGNVIVDGNVTAVGGRAFGYGSANSAIHGNVSYTSGAADAPFVTFEPGSTIDGNLIITTRQGNDSITLGGTVGGNVVVNLGNGTNIFGDAGTILGSLTVIGGNGADQVFLENAVVSGNFTASLGNGNDSIDLGNGAVNFQSGPVITGPATILGSSITLLLDNGNDTFTVGANGLHGPGARLSAYMGNGNDSVAFNATNTQLFSALIDGGNGNDTFTLTGVITFPFTLRNF